MDMQTGTDEVQAVDEPFGAASRSLVDLLFARRGWSPQVLVALNDPSFPPLKDMDRLVKILAQIHRDRQVLVVMPDYDMDGISAGTLGYAGFAELGFDVRLYVPDYRDGHDIMSEAVDKLAAAFPEAAAVITCDAGVNSLEGMARGAAHGLRMLVTDHHTQTSHGSTAEVIVDPARTDETYPNEGICGAMVLWEVLDAFARAHQPDKVRSIGLLRLFAGLGTVSDVMPLVMENRQVVRDSVAIAKMLAVPIPAADTATVYEPEDSVLMQILRSEEHHPLYVRAFAGFALALKAFREHGPMVPERQRGVVRLDEDGQPVMVRGAGPLRSVEDLSEEFYSFYMAPTFNAVRRMNGSMGDAFGIFFESDPQTRWQCMIRLLEDNYRRREVSKELTEQLRQAHADGDQPLAPWVWIAPKGTLPGMLGLLAGALSSEYDLPLAVVLKRKNGSLGGSMRAPEWFEIIETMGAIHGYQVQGHQQACGVRLDNLASARDFASLLSQEVAQAQQDAAGQGVQLGSKTCDLVFGDAPGTDATLDRHEDFLELASAIEALAPFGQGFPAPTVELVLSLPQCTVRTLGSSAQHLKITTRSGLKVLWWNEADRLGELMERSESMDPEVSTLRLVTRLGVNTYRDHTSPQFTVLEAIPCPAQEAQ